MGDELPALHNSYDCRLGLKSSIRRHSFMRLLIFLLGFFELHLINLDSILFMGKPHVDGEGIILTDVSSFRMFGERAQLSTCKRLQSALDLVLRCRTSVF